MKMTHLYWFLGAVAVGYLIGYEYQNGSAAAQSNVSSIPGVTTAFNWGYGVTGNTAA